MSSVPNPDDVNTKADLAAAMAVIRANANISLGDIASASGSAARQRISKTTASNIETAGSSWPTEKSLRAFLVVCGRPADEIEQWCRTLELLRPGVEQTERSRAPRKAGPVATPEGELWHELFTFSLVKRMTNADFATAFPTLKALVGRAAETLNAAKETGPAYTLHGVGHATAVVRRIGELLGPQVQQLTCHETQLLILAAFFHDVGRVPSACGPPSAHQLRRYAEQAGRLGFGSGPDLTEVPAPVLEDYCCWDRTRRLRDYLNKLPPELLEWDGVPMRETLGMICEQQAAPVGSALPPRALPTVDIALCSSLLRLATRLELCSLQPAGDIYGRLGIERRTTPRAGPEDLEWATYVRHLKLVLGRGKDDYEVGAEAVVMRPVAEFDLRKAFEALDSEFLHCRAARGSWKARWRGLPLPSKVDISNVKSIGYTYEKLTFELVRDDVLELLSGTRLYGNHHVFVRELLQNAIDAVRLRAILDPDLDSRSIAISSWEENGSIWFRIDDDGIGMDLHAIREYFLQVGRSYYNSEDLDRELRRAGQRYARFSAISRFGIGIMSCFMLGDRIEVSTRKYEGHDGENLALRLSVNQREDFAMLRKEGEGYDPMPTRPGDPEFDFRENCGTTIAVHIDGTKHYVTPGTLLGHAAHFHFSSDCALTLNGKVHAGIDLDKPLIGRPASLQRVVSTTRGNGFTARFLGKARIWAVPLDLSRSSPDPRVRGQLISIVATPPAPAVRTALELLTSTTRSQVNPVIRELLAQTPISLSAHANLEEVTLACTIGEPPKELLSRLGLEDIKGRPGSWSGEIRRRLDELHPSEFNEVDVQILSSFSQETIYFTGKYEASWSGENFPSGRWWSHNGVTLPVRWQFEYQTDGDDDDRHVEIQSIKLNSGRASNSVFSVGNVGFLDELRPNLSLSRDEMQDVPFAMAAALHLAIHRAIPSDLPPDVIRILEDYWRESHVLGYYPSVDVETVLGALNSSGKGWSDEAVLMVGGRLHTLDEVSAMADKGEVELEFGRDSIGLFAGPADAIGATLALRRLNLRWRAAKNSSGDGQIIASPGPVRDLPAGLKWFPPLLFLAHESGKGFRPHPGPWNIDHPVCRWILNCSPDLRERMPGYFAELREVFLHAIDESSMSSYIEDLERQERLNLSDFPIYDYLEGGSSRSNWTHLNKITLTLIRHVTDRITQIAPGLRPPQEVRRLLEAAGLRHLRLPGPIVKTNPRMASISVSPPANVTAPATTALTRPWPAAHERIPAPRAAIMLSSNVIASHNRRSLSDTSVSFVGAGVARLMPLDQFTAFTGAR